MAYLRNVTIREKILNRISVDERGCWLWNSYLNQSGYGKVGIKKVQKLAHRASYEEFVGPIPEGRELDHLCRVRACVNPSHLEPVTSKTNCLRGQSFAAQNARKTHCLRGHLLAGGNISLFKCKNGVSRHCRACRSERDAERRLACQEARP